MTMTESFPLQYLKKLNRQERVIEEVKMVSKPYYQRKDITKDEYKEIMRKAVPKVGNPSLESYEISLYLISSMIMMISYDQNCLSLFNRFAIVDLER